LIVDKRMLDNVADNPHRDWNAISFLDLYDSVYSKMLTDYQHAAWLDAISPDADLSSAVVTLELAMSGFRSNDVVLDMAIALLRDKKELDPANYQRARRIFLAGVEHSSLTGSQRYRLLAESQHAATIAGYEYKLKGETCTIARLEELVAHSSSEADKLGAWCAIMEIGAATKDGLARLRPIRNQVARDFGFSSYFDLQAAEMEFTADELVCWMDGALKAIEPVSKRLVTWIQKKAAPLAGDPGSDLLPIHMTGSRFGQDWSSFYPNIERLDAALSNVQPRCFFERADAFWHSLGFTPLPHAFWTRSSLTPLATVSGEPFLHGASCWHMDLKKDIRCLAAATPSLHWYAAAHHEVGHAHYYLTCGQSSLPAVLRCGASRSFHEAIAELTRVNALQPKYFAAQGFTMSSPDVNNALRAYELLGTALPLFLWSAGPITHFESDLYSWDLPLNHWHTRWTSYASDFQKVRYPLNRGTDVCDPAAVGPISTQPCYHFNYALAICMRYQLFEYLCESVAGVNPLDSELSGHKRVGNWLYDAMRVGGSVSGRELYQTLLGCDISWNPFVRRCEWLLDQLERDG
jgi:peptidyl-dipeptidase A